jgi:hypothetical protein
MNDMVANKNMITNFTDEKEAVRITRYYIEKQFPKTCASCGKKYATLKDYLSNTRHVGQPISYDAEMNDWEPDMPAGTFSLANCSCNNTLAITSANFPLPIIWKLMRWARNETKRRGVSINTLLEHVRQKIDEQVLAENR